MSIVQDLRTRARHRGRTPFQLIQKIGRLERENDGMACQLVGLTTEVGELLAERNQLERQLDTDRTAATATIERLDERYVETVTEMQREIDGLKRRIQVGVLAEAAAAQTQEIDASSIRARFASGPVVSLHHSPHAA